LRKRESPKRRVCIPRGGRQPISETCTPRHRSSPTKKRKKRRDHYRRKRILRPQKKKKTKKKKKKTKNELEEFGGNLVATRFETSKLRLLTSDFCRNLVGGVLFGKGFWGGTLEGGERFF